MLKIESLNPKEHKIYFTKNNEIFVPNSDMTNFIKLSDKLELLKHLRSKPVFEDGVLAFNVIKSLYPFKDIIYPLISYKNSAEKLFNFISDKEKEDISYEINKEYSELILKSSFVINALPKFENNALLKKSDNKFIVPKTKISNTYMLTDSWYIYIPHKDTNHHNFEVEHRPNFEWLSLSIKVDEYAVPLDMTANSSYLDTPESLFNPNHPNAEKIKRKDKKLQGIRINNNKIIRASSLYRTILLGIFDNL